MESGGGLNLAIKRAKPNTAGPSSIPGPKTQEEVALNKSEKKTKSKNPGDRKLPKQTATAVDQSNEKSNSTLDTSNRDVQSSSTPKNKQKVKLKKIDSET